MTKATEIIHWPGHDVPACEEHAAKLKALAGIMGFAVGARPCLAEEICTNCESEAKRRAAAAG